MACSTFPFCTRPLFVSRSEMRKYTVDFSCTYVFLRTDTAGHPLQSDYTDTFRVLQRTTNHLFLDQNVHRTTVSIDRLKVTFLNIRL
ncbi:unnamed protein product [Dicrocoelium dendriticum]|nr:unnamed protein product [Dicrocoelium dendriticum]